ncbi:DNA-binding PadR family transcriptional regulator [Jatrophihabitans sp. GAS493]|uniref:PadR family transcriptional regulator n=1 Tax=Jatrophihabitans sp. GAS493 TaxID=1907575 RepID=UPI000BB78916|nr:PadR family transcriptional regulator [Jatrophihabitans sp. GAS493]SOD70712.1 DNA-binding PadR family transcriptional regulator [Jatrophihabitans sp. GAS493]
MSVRYALLTLLERQPMYGYQLRQEFESSTASTWPLNVGQVYTTLQRLERDGLVETSEPSSESDTDDPQRIYAITDRGRVEVQHWFATPVRHQAPPRDELAIKLALAVRIPGMDVRSVIQTQRISTIRALQEYTRSREAAGGDLSWLLVAESLIFAAEAEVRWLDHCEATLLRHSAGSAASSGPQNDAAKASHPGESARTQVSSTARKGGRR